MNPPSIVLGGGGARYGLPAHSLIAIRELCNIRDGIELPFATNLNAVTELMCIN